MSLRGNIDARLDTFILGVCCAMIFEDVMWHHVSWSTWFVVGVLALRAAIALWDR